MVVEAHKKIAAASNDLMMKALMLFPRRNSGFAAEEDLKPNAIPWVGKANKPKLPRPSPRLGVAAGRQARSQVACS